MTDTTWLTESWIWWIALYALGVYECWALWTQAAHTFWGVGTPKPSYLITLSRMFWRAQKRSPAVAVIVLGPASWLLAHFFVTYGTWPDEGVWSVIFFVVLYAVHRTARKVQEHG